MIDAKQLRQMAVEAVATNADVEFKGVILRQWIYNEKSMTLDQYANHMRADEWVGQLELCLLAKSLDTPIEVYVQPKMGTFMLKHVFLPASMRGELGTHPPAIHR